MKPRGFVAFVAVFAAGAALTAALGAGRRGGSVFTERELVQAQVDLRVAEATAAGWRSALDRATRVSMDRGSDTSLPRGMGEGMVQVLVQAMSGEQRAGLDVAAARERLKAMREMGGEAAKPDAKNDGNADDKPEAK